MIHQRRPRLSRAGDDIHYTIRNRFLKIFASCIEVMLVVSAGFNTTVLPHASAGASFHAAISNGKFQGKFVRQLPETGVRAPETHTSACPPTGMIKEMRRHQWQIHIPALLNRLAPSIVSSTANSRDFS